MTYGEAGPLPPLASTPLPPPPLPTASPLRVEITFALTFEELREGVTQSPETPKQPKNATKVLSLLACLLLILVFAMVNLIMKQRAPFVRPAAAPVFALPLDAPPARVEFTIAVMPSLLAAMVVADVIMLGFVLVWIANAKSVRVRRASRQISIVGALLLVLVILVGMVKLSATPQQVGWTVTRSQAILFSAAPWIVNVALFLALTVQFSRRQLRRQWQSKPGLSREHTIILDDQGKRSIDAINDLLHRWPHFQRAWESANVLVLHDENNFRHILPKRVMDQTTLDQARAVIANHIADCKFLTTPGGFPVATAHPAPAV